MGMYFDKFAQEGNKFLKDLATDLGHPEEINRVAILLRSTLHILRDRITVSESFNFLSQLPMFLKALYVENWKYREKPERIQSIEEFKEKVKEEQARYGEQAFDWDIHTEDIIKKVFKALGRYVSEGEIQDIYAQVPQELHPLFKDAT
jgi:uncharacterized protein (DUF2267 family)